MKFVDDEYVFTTTACRSGAMYVDSSQMRLHVRDYKTDELKFYGAYIQFRYCARREYGYWRN